MTFSQPTQEALKTFGRVLLLAVIPVVISGLQSGKTLRDILVAVTIAVLVAIDEYIHRNPEIQANGLLPF